MNSFLKALGNTRVYPLTDTQISGRSHAEQVVELSDNGVRVVQLREKNLSSLEFYRVADAAISNARERGVTVILNDRVDIALALNAEGVHLGQDDLPAEAARRILGPTAIIGVSTHNAAQARLAAQMPVDYVALGPIFPTLTKSSSNPPLGVAAVREVRALIRDIPLVAIGGITEANSQELWEAGADAIAMVAEFWRPEAAAADRRRRLSQPRR